MTLTGPGGRARRGSPSRPPRRRRSSSRTESSGFRWRRCAIPRSCLRPRPGVGDHGRSRAMTSRDARLGSAGKWLLLVLDNAEHLLPALAPRHGRARRGCPTLTLVVTSRERLQSPARRLPGAAARRQRCGALFIERARALDPTSRPTRRVPSFAAAGQSATRARARRRPHGAPLARATP